MTTQTPAFSPEQEDLVKHQLGKILKTPYFEAKEYPSKILRLIVEEALRGFPSTEETIGLAIYGEAFSLGKRRKEANDATVPLKKQTTTKDQTVVRAHMGSVRQGVWLFYATEGIGSRVRIQLLTHQYTPTFTFSEPALVAATPSDSRMAVRIEQIRGCVGVLADRHALPRLLVKCAEVLTQFAEEPVAILGLRDAVLILIEFNCSQRGYDNIRRAVAEQRLTTLADFPIKAIDAVGVLYEELGRTRSRGLENLYTPVIDLAACDRSHIGLVISSDIPRVGSGMFITNHDDGPIYLVSLGIVLLDIRLFSSRDGVEWYPTTPDPNDHWLSAESRSYRLLEDRIRRRVLHVITLPIARPNTPVNFVRAQFRVVQQMTYSTFSPISIDLIEIPSDNKQCPLIQLRSGSSVREIIPSSNESSVSLRNLFEFDAHLHEHWLA